jgi:serine/threonine protein kinase
MSSNPEYAPGEVIANKYVVEGLVGESPAARTFLANSNSGRLAIKIYRPEISAKLMQAPDFFLKAVVMTEIGHDNLAACLDVQEEMGRVFSARQYVEGESFEDWARRHRGEPGNLARGLELLWQICQGLTGLHERTRHLNIHPGNVIVGPVVAKLCDPDPRALGNTEMTPDPLPLRPEYRGYRAPEMAGRGSGFLSYPNSDLFAVGGLLYRLIKGEHPPSNPAQTLSEARALDREVALFLGKALHPKPEERFQEAGAFADALWELQSAMQRLQERAGERPAARPVASPNPSFAAADPFSAAPPAKEPTLFGEPSPASPSAAPPATPSGKDSDSFFDFFPAETPQPAARGNGAAAPPAFPAADPFPSAPAKQAGDTLFGAPVPYPPQPAARNDPFRSDPPPSRGGLGDLERPGTLFGDRAPVPSPSPSGKGPRGPAVPPKPMAVSLSSLERDPLEAAQSEEGGGFTTYGFKGAGDNRTGIYNPDGNAAAAKAKLRLLLGVAGGVAILAGLAGLFIFLRGHAADGAKPAEAPVAETDEPSSPPPPEAPSARPRPAGGPAADQPYPDEPSPEAPSHAAPPAAAQAAPEPRTAGYSEPPMPVEPPRPGSNPEAAAPAAKPPKTEFQGNAHVSAEREAQLMAMVQSRDFPASAGERLRAADDLNDLGRVAEANLLYGKALAADAIGEKQKISALGGLAVTFQSMGMKAQAKDAIEKILAINPRNAFAQKMKAKLN